MSSKDTLGVIAIAVAARTPVLLWGGPGVGKTASVVAMAEAAGMPLEIVIASIREPSDFAGLPVIDGSSVHWAPPRWASRLAQEGRGLLFLDELTTAPPAVQAALMRVVLERTVGDLRLPDEVAIIAAANPPELAADGWNLAAPLANRFVHVDWQLDPRAFTEGLVSGFTASPIPEVDTALLGRAQRARRASVAAFLSTRPSLVHRVPDDEAAAGRAWPSPRTWEMAASLLAHADAAGSSDSVAMLLVAGCVGIAVAAEYLAWTSDLDLPDPEAVLADPDSLVLPQRADRAYAVLASVTAAVLHEPTVDRWNAAWRAVAVAASQGQPDIAVSAARTLLKNRPAGAVPPAELLRPMAPVLREAGLLDLPGDPPR